MSDVLGMLVFFGCILAIVVAALRHRYRMKLLAAAVQSPAFSQAAFATARQASPDVDGRVEALEEKLAWLERLIGEVDPVRGARGALTTSGAKGLPIGPAAECDGRGDDAIYRPEATAARDVVLGGLSEIRHDR